MRLGTKVSSLFVKIRKEMKPMERNNFDNKIEGSKYIFSDAEERFAEENARKV